MLSCKSQFKSAPSQRNGVSQEDDAQMPSKTTKLIGCDMGDKGEQQQTKGEETPITTTTAIKDRHIFITENLEAASQASSSFLSREFEIRHHYQTAFA